MCVHVLFSLVPHNGLIILLNQSKFKIVVLTFLLLACGLVLLFSLCYWSSIHRNSCQRSLAKWPVPPDNKGQRLSLRNNTQEDENTMSDEIYFQVSRKRTQTGPDLTKVFHRQQWVGDARYPGGNGLIVRVMMVMLMVTMTMMMMRATEITRLSVALSTQDQSNTPDPPCTRYNVMTMIIKTRLLKKKIMSRW